jgi:pimeloyl-ACP methyl ester carboxylesterase
MPCVNLPSAELHYRADGVGPPLLLLHGAGGNSLVWFQQIPTFCEYFNCFAIDQPGFGKSEWVDEPVEYADVLSEVVEHFRWRKVGILGHSLGGWAALRFTHRHPGQVAALIISSSWAGIQSPDILTSIEERDERLEQLRQAWRERREGSHLPSVSPNFKNERPDLHWLAEGISAYNGKGPSMAWDPTYSAIMTPETLPADLHGWSVPTLCLVGTEDVYVPTKTMRALARILNDAPVVEIRGAGHWTFLEDAEKFNESVLMFLRKYLT